MFAPKPAKFRLADLTCRSYLTLSNAAITWKYDYNNNANHTKVAGSRTVINHLALLPAAFVWSPSLSSCLGHGGGFNDTVTTH